MNPPPRTILYIHSGHDWVRGSERVLLDLASNLPASRYRPAVWCDAEIFRQACRDLGLSVVDHSFPPRIDQPWWRADPASIEAAARVIRETQAALLHVNTLECLPWSVRAGRAGRLPVVSHLHIPPNPEERIWSGLHQVTVAVGVSRFSLSWAGVDGLEPAATRLIYNAVFPERLERGSALRLREELGIPTAALLAVTVGSLIPLKDIATVIDAVARCVPDGADVHLVVLGSGEERSALEAHAGQAGVAGRVHFLGDRQDVGAILRDAADLSISAARSESLGLNLIEAGYFGVPSIASAIPAHREVLDDGRNGILFEPGSAEDLARKIVMLRNAPELRAQLGERARQGVRQLFVAERFVAQFTQLYDEVVAWPRRRHGWLWALRFPSCYWRFGWERLRKGQRRKP